MMACGSAQSDQCLRCPLTESLDTMKCINGEQIPRWDFAQAWDESKAVHFAHARRHLFAWRGQNISSSKAEKNNGQGNTTMQRSAAEMLLY